MFKLMGKTLKNLGKNTAIGIYSAGKTATNFVGESLENAKFEATQEELKDFEEQLEFLPPDERAAVLEMAKQKRLEAMADSKAKLVVTNMQLAHKKSKKEGEIDPATLKALAKILQAQK
ncbi:MULTISPECIES: hypothetical protein [Bacteria]|uniref:hypothetical protein n=1 Tax=Bacteria TaxID=2 RepID=UPI003F34F00E